MIEKRNKITMDPEQVQQKTSLKRIFLQNFIAGIGWGLGATVGVVILLGILSWIISIIGALPIVGNFLADIISTTQEALKLRQTP